MTKEQGIEKSKQIMDRAMQVLPFQCREIREWHDLRSQEEFGDILLGQVVVPESYIVTVGDVKFKAQIPGDIFRSGPVDHCLVYLVSDLYREMNRHSMQQLNLIEWEAGPEDGV